MLENWVDASRSRGGIGERSKGKIKNKNFNIKKPQKIESAEQFSSKYLSEAGNNDEGMQLSAKLPPYVHFKFLSEFTK